ncbi:MAG: hypothetical protein RR662_07310 [Clostridia bacterium]
MEDVYILGINNDYTPPSSSFCIFADNFELEVANDIKSITKISLSPSGLIEESFKSLDKFYKAVLIKLIIRVDYMCNENNMNFHIFEIDKYTYINTGDFIIQNTFDVDVVPLDCGIISIQKRHINLYTLLSACIP